MKQNLLEKAGIFLLKKGFTVKSLTGSCFDVIARKEENILLIKLLEDANSISKEFSEEMQKISSYLAASPIIISEKAGIKLEDNVVYSRFDIYTLNFNTFKNCIDNKFPFIKSDHAGLTAHISSKRLNEIIKEKGISTNTLARKIGVSASMVKKYEAGNVDLTINKALKLYNYLGPSVFDRIDIFSKRLEEKDSIKTEISRKYSDLGFRATDIKKVPFDVVAKKEKEIILTKIGDKASPHLESVSRLIDADRLAIFKKEKPKDIPAMTKKEFFEFKTAKELIRFLKEF